MMAVVTEDDCTSTVARMPTARPAKGLATPSKSFFAVSAPTSLTELSMSLTATRNPASRARTSSSRTGHGMRWSRADHPSAIGFFSSKREP